MTSYRLDPDLQESRIVGDYSPLSPQESSMHRTLLRLGALIALLLNTAIAHSAEYAWTDANGGKQSLAALKGEPVVLHFWATWCPPCRKEMPEIEAWIRQHDGVRLFPISLDRKAVAAQTFLDEQGSRLPVLHGKMSGAMMLGVRGLPATVIIGADGNVKKVFTGAMPWSDAKFTERILAELNS
jgi:thiol-disulfide isomerase/thioredoxin